MYATHSTCVYHGITGRGKNILLSNAITVSRKFRCASADWLKTRDNRECDFKVDSFRLHPAWLFQVFSIFHERQNHLCWIITIFRSSFCTRLSLWVEIVFLFPFWFFFLHPSLFFSPSPCINFSYGMRVVWRNIFIFTFRSSPCCSLAPTDWIFARYSVRRTTTNRTMARTWNGILTTTKRALARWCAWTPREEWRRWRPGCATEPDVGWARWTCVSTACARWAILCLSSLSFVVKFHAYNYAFSTDDVSNVKRRRGNYIRHEL